MSRKGKEKEAPAKEVGIAAGDLCRLPDGTVARVLEVKFVDDPAYPTMKVVMRRRMG